MVPSSNPRAVRGLVAGVVLAATGVPAQAADVWEALTGGKLDFYMRYRFEYVNDGQQPPPVSAPALEDAFANTVRSAVGYTTGLFHGFGAYLQLEDVRVIGGELYNSASNGALRRAQVVDPEGTELQQANLRYRGIPKTQVWLGRQNIEHRGAPLHRYVGTILWRQNWQSIDAIRAVSDFFPSWKLDYTYAWNVNRIFGEDHPTNSDFEMDSHLFKADWSAFTYGTFEPYVYLIDMESTAANERFSTATYGLRFQGGYDLVTEAARILYTAEFAHQVDWADNPNAIAVNYYLGELGVTKNFPGPALTAVTLRASIEVLEGDGLRAFQTPLGTNHAFQGWADRFLITPGDGIVDVFGTLSATLHGATLQVMYHDFDSDRDGYDYGTEWNVQITRTFRDHYLLGVKFADYDADRNALNIARNTGSRQSFDLTKFWGWLEIRF